MKLFITSFVFFMVIGLGAIGLKHMIMPSKTELAQLEKFHQCIREHGHSRDKVYQQYIDQKCNEQSKN